MVVCGCSEFVGDLESWYAWHVGDTKVWQGIEAVAVAIFKAFLHYPGEMVLYAIGEVFLTMTFNFYYLGYVIGRISSFIFKP
jgi:hypothetical protein